MMGAKRLGLKPVQGSLCIAGLQMLYGDKADGF